MQSISRNDHCVFRATLTLALLSAYQEYLVTLKLMTSFVVQSMTTAYEIRPAQSRSMPTKNNCTFVWVSMGVIYNLKVNVKVARVLHSKHYRK